LRRILGGLEMDDSPSTVIKYNHGIKQPKRCGRDGEHVDRDDDCHMVPQKAPPSRGGSPGAPRQIPSNGSLTDVDAKLEQFAVDARCAPKRVVDAHLTDQVAYFVARLGPSGTARSPSPVNPKALAMPFDHSRRFDEYQGFEDLRPHSVKPDPQEPVGGKEPKSVTALPAQDDHLMSQCDKLELQ
jgi:hypothetical protein